MVGKSGLRLFAPDPSARGWGAPALIPVLIPICFFGAERVSQLIAAASGLETYRPLLAACFCLCVPVVCLGVKKRVSWLPCALLFAAGIAAGSLLAPVTLAGRFLSRAGAGMLLCADAALIVFAARGIRWKKPSRQALYYAAAVLVLSNLFAFLYARSCEFIYYWDNATYWTIGRDIAAGRLSGDFFGLLYRSVLTEDYNALAGLAPGLFAYLFGGSRIVYIFAVTNCCFVPGALMLRALAKDARGAATVTALLPVLLFLALTGFVDVFGFALGAACFLLAEKPSWRRGLAIGLLLLAMLLFRRWYAFFALSFILAMLLRAVVERRGFLCVGCALVQFGFPLATLFLPLVTGKLLADYAALYAGYKFPILTDLRLFARYFGVIPAALLLCGAICCLLKRDTRVLLPLAQAALCFALFVRTQTHGQQHLLLYAPALAVIAAYTLEKLDRKEALAALALSLCVSANTLVDRVQPQSLAEIDHLALIPDFSMRGRKRADAYEILAIKNDLDARCGGAEVGVNLSSLNLNASVFRNVQPSLNAPEHDSSYLHELPAVDSRDRTLDPFYEMDYIMSAYPAQTHLGEDKQQTVVCAARCLRDGEAFGAAYDKLDVTYETGGVTLELYRRTRAVTEAEKNAFAAMVRDARISREE